LNPREVSGDLWITWNKAELAYLTLREDVQNVCLGIV